MFSKSYFLLIFGIIALAAYTFSSSSFDKQLTSNSNNTLQVQPQNISFELKHNPAIEDISLTADQHILQLLKSKIVYEGFAQVKSEYIGYVSFIQNDSVVRLSFLDLRFLGIDYMVPNVFSHYIKLTYNDSEYIGFTEPPKGYENRERISLNDENQTGRLGANNDNFN
jgi:hypothetical protein